jgi:hypothetical protein
MWFNTVTTVFCNFLVPRFNCCTNQSIAYNTKKLRSLHTRCQLHLCSNIKASFCLAMSMWRNRLLSRRQRESEWVRCWLWCVRQAASCQDKRVLLVCVWRLRLVCIPTFFRRWNNFPGPIVVECKVMYWPDVNQMPLHLLPDTLCTVMFYGSHK